jgi:hypothetical protein
VEDILDWVLNSEFDGIYLPDVTRVPRSLGWNLAARLNERAEHQDLDPMWLLAGGPETVGEMASYVAGQWDSVYDGALSEALLDVLAWETADFENLASLASDSEAAVSGEPMLLGLGSLEQSRFVTMVAAGDVEACATAPLGTASTPTTPEPYALLSLGWSYVLTQASLPYIRYGEEFGMAGYLPPDSHRPLWLATDDLADEPALSVSAVAERLTNAQAGVLSHVKTLLDARAGNRAFREGKNTELYLDAESYVYARSLGADGVVVALNRGAAAQILELDLSTSGLPTNGTFQDLFSGAFYAVFAGSLTVTVPAQTSLVLVPVD